MVGNQLVYALFDKLIQVSYLSKNIIYVMQILLGSKFNCRGGVQVS
jgi:hypothetical protein